MVNDLHVYNNILCLQVKSGGEDAFFVSEMGYGAVGVADGVSGWSKDGVDAAIYPRTLLHHSKLAFENDKEGIGPVELMMLGQNQTKLIGSCTACMATMKPGNKLEIANLGDSGFRLLRDGAVFLCSKVGQYPVASNICKGCSFLTLIFW